MGQGCDNGFLCVIRKRDTTTNPSFISHIKHIFNLKTMVFGKLNAVLEQDVEQFLSSDHWDREMRFHFFK